MIPRGLDEETKLEVVAAIKRGVRTSALFDLFPRLTPTGLRKLRKEFRLVAKAGNVGRVEMAPDVRRRFLLALEDRVASWAICERFSVTPQYVAQQRRELGFDKPDAEPRATRAKLGRVE